MLHGVLGGALLVSVVLKLVRSGPATVRVGRRRALAAIAVSLAAVASVGAGFGSVLAGGLVVLGPWTLLSWHVVAGLVLAPWLVVHLVPARWRLLVPRRLQGASRQHRRDSQMRPRTVASAAQPRLPRRAFLGAVAMGLLGGVAWWGADAVDRVRGGDRRFTGSRWLPAGGVPPITTFFGESQPPIDASGWGLQVRGRVERPLTLSLAELAALGTVRETATLDCTSGWAIETDWHGTPLGTVLERAGVLPQATRVEVRSATGWGAGLGVAEARGALLATHVAGAPLPHGNGAPCRLVVPGRRGLDWVKWVTEVEVI